MITRTHTTPYRLWIPTLMTLCVSSGCADSEGDDGSTPTPAASNVGDLESSDKIIGNWTAVPYICQLNYKSIKESACAPTSVTMLLRYYFPNSRVDVPEIYHAGAQTYTYSSGPAYGYQNVSFGCGVTGCDAGLDPVPSTYRKYYLGTYSGVTLTYMLNFLNRIWGMSNVSTTTIDGVYSELAKGPLLGQVYGLGNSSYGHYLVIVGIDDRGTSSRTDDLIVVNDPYDWASPIDCVEGKGRKITYQDFFVKSGNGSPWFRSAYRLVPAETTSQGKYTVVVDTGNSDFEGNSLYNSFQLDDFDAVTSTGKPMWNFYYGGGGDWYFPTEGGRAARWTPRLAVTGYYEVSVKFRADPSSGKVTYTLYDSTGKSLATKTVDQYKSSNTWSYVILSSSIKLSPGAYVRASNIPAKTNVDAVKFKYISP